eukprot:315126_1
MKADALCFSIDLIYRSNMNSFPRSQKLMSESQETKKNETFVRWNAASLYTPPLNDIQKALENGLSSHFKTYKVNVVKCPDLSKWGTLAAKGICGNTKLIEVGGPKFMTSKFQKRTYSMIDMLKICNMPKALIIGAAAVSYPVIGNNAELIPNIFLNTEENKNNNDNTHYALINKFGSPKVDLYNNLCHGCFANLFVSDGNNNDNVLYIRCKQRIGSVNFVSVIRECLKQYLTENNLDTTKQIGVGGVIKVLNGKINSLIMPNYPDYAKSYGDILNYSNEKLQQWLNFYDYGPNLIMMSCIITEDPTPSKLLDVRHEHTHFYSLDGTNQGGHFMQSATNDIEYEAYFSLANSFYRIDDAQYTVSKL